MREISDNGIDFAMTLRYYGQPDREKELLAFSRILNDDELLIVLNANTSDPWKGHVVVDYSLNEKATKWEVIYSIKSTSAPASVKIDTRPKGSVKVSRVTGETTDGPVRTLNIALQPMEIQILKGITLH
ncbi:MAG TPA: hypothetical protein VHY08_03090 [Bacillota bacterium]|nr:hypothetical protein [Bacillota bacterium]